MLHALGAATRLDAGNAVEFMAIGIVGQTFQEGGSLRVGFLELRGADKDQQFLERVVGFGGVG